MTADPLLAALFDRLPDPAGPPFDPFDRTRWLTALAACLDIVYGPQPRPPAATPTEEPRRGPTVTGRAPCPRCGVILSPQGRPAHEAMHRRDDEAAARKAERRAAVPPEAEVTAPPPPAPPLVVAEPIARQPFDPDAARRRAADATA